MPGLQARGRPPASARKIANVTGPRCRRTQPGWCPGGIVAIWGVSPNAAPQPLVPFEPLQCKGRRCRGHKIAGHMEGLQHTVRTQSVLSSLADPWSL